MATSKSSKSFKKGSVIFRQNHKGDVAYLIDKGNVELFLGEGSQRQSIGSVTEGDLFGEMAMIDGSLRTATAVAVSDCELIEISKEQLQERIEEADPIVHYLLTGLLARLRNTMTRSVEMMQPKDKAPAGLTNIINFSDFKRDQGVLEKIKMEQSLKNALKNDEFNINYQPILDFKTGEVAGFEALMRWSNEERGFVRPDVFMGIAEETTLIIPLGHWIINRVIKDFASLKEMVGSDHTDKHFFMSINIAAKQFKDPSLFRVLLSACKKYKIHPKEIKLEITERVLIAGDHVYEWISNARKLGFSVALDDFGTGYSSLSYLASLEVNNLKIDKSFVSKILTDKKTASIVKAIIDLSRSLDLTVIAEGVETKEEWDKLKSYKCHYMQGYLYSKPLDFHSLIDLLTKRVAKKAA